MIIDNAGAYNGNESYWITNVMFTPGKVIMLLKVSISNNGSDKNTIIRTLSGTDNYVNWVTDPEFRVKKLPYYLVTFKFHE
jgi:hypothetical protein